QCFILLLGKACFCYTLGEYEHSLQSFRKLLEDWQRSTPPYVHLGIGLCCLKLQKWDVARFAFLRCIELDRDKAAATTITDNQKPSDRNLTMQAHLGLALVYLNQTDFSDQDCQKLMNMVTVKQEKKRGEREREEEDDDDDDDEEGRGADTKSKNNEEEDERVDLQRKRENLRKALFELTQAWKMDPSNPQTLTMIANFLGFSWSDPTLVQKLGGTAYHFCLQSTKLFDMTPTEDDIAQGIRNTWMEQLHHTLYTHHHNHNGVHDNHGGGHHFASKYASQFNNKIRVTPMSGGTQNGHGELPLTACLHPLLQCQAEACYVIGKMYHCQNDYDNAILWYYKSVMLCPYLELALFGLAQMYLTDKFFNIGHCKTCLERIVYDLSTTNAHTPGFHDSASSSGGGSGGGVDSWLNQSNQNRNVIRADSNVLKLLNYCHMKEKNFKTAQKYLLKAIDLNPDNDVDLWLLLGYIHIHLYMYMYTYTYLYK
ncbi:TPR Domain containing protein, partial [Reticulomyxa filosa]